MAQYLDFEIISAALTTGSVAEDASLDRGRTGERSQPAEAQAVFEVRERAIAIGTVTRRRRLEGGSNLGQNPPESGKYFSWLFAGAPMP
jgi:hypothetical protein